MLACTWDARRPRIASSTSAQYWGTPHGVLATRVTLQRQHADCSCHVMPCCSCMPFTGCWSAIPLQGFDCLQMFLDQHWVALQQVMCSYTGKGASLSYETVTCPNLHSSTCVRTKEIFRTASQGSCLLLPAGHQLSAAPPYAPFLLDCPSLHMPTWLALTGPKAINNEHAGCSLLTTHKSSGLNQLSILVLKGTPSAADI